jgi:hypothetical protein
MNLRNEGNSNEAIEFHRILNSLEFSNSSIQTNSKSIFTAIQELFWF